MASLNELLYIIEKDVDLSNVSDVWAELRKQIQTLQMLAMRLSLDSITYNEMMKEPEDEEWNT